MKRRLVHIPDIRFAYVPHKFLMLLGTVEATGHTALSHTPLSRNPQRDQQYTTMGAPRCHNPVHLIPPHPQGAIE